MNAYRSLDDEARQIARDLLGGASSAALGTLRGDVPMVTRAGCLWMPGTGVVLLLSDLSDHARALAENPACSLLLGEPGGRGDPLTHPRLTVMGRAVPCDKDALRGAYLAARPKAGLYFDFTDFRLLRIDPYEALLNGGFGKAYRLDAAELEAL